MRGIHAWVRGQGQIQVFFKSGGFSINKIFVFDATMVAQLIFKGKQPGNLALQSVPGLLQRMTGQAAQNFFYDRHQGDAVRVAFFVFEETQNTGELRVVGIYGRFLLD